MKKNILLLIAFTLVLTLGTQSSNGLEFDNEIDFSADKITFLGD